LATNLPAALLSAVVDRIIPADEFPSASQAGVLNYITRQLDGDCRDFVEPLNEGLALIEKTAVDETGKPFASLGAEQQDSLLKQIENKPFFVRLVDLTSEGFYADPGNGGNLNGISWKMIGYEPRVRGNLA
jgi:hypothetical protein